MSKYNNTNKSQLKLNNKYTNELINNNIPTHDNTLN